jgi:hypothetical protein
MFINLRYELDAHDTTWSNQCGYGEFTMTDIPSFCVMRDPDDETDTWDRYDVIDCTASLTHDDVDPQPYTIGITRSNPSVPYTESSFTIQLNVNPDCSFVVWEPPVDPTDTFWVYEMTDDVNEPENNWTPDRNTEVIDGLNWNSQCGISNIDYPGL